MSFLDIIAGLALIVGFAFWDKLRALLSRLEELKDSVEELRSERLGQGLEELKDSIEEIKSRLDELTHS